MRNNKLIPPGEIDLLCEKLHSQGAVIVFTNGVFDLLHPGHVQYLAKAARMGTHLIVALNTDESTRKIKGAGRPVVPLDDRVEILSAFEFVHHVTWFEEETPAEIIRKVRPDVLVKGGDWKPEKIIGKDFVESYGGKVFSIPFIPGYSTTNIIERILKLPRT